MLKKTEKLGTGPNNFIKDFVVITKKNKRLSKYFLCLKLLLFRKTNLVYSGDNIIQIQKIM